MIEKKYILEYIRDTINTCEIGKSTIKNAKFHHNSAYTDAPSVIRHGILSLEDLNKLKIISMAEEKLKLFADTDSHINGTSGVSLSVIGLTDLYKDEDEYDPTSQDAVDFLVDSSIKARRTSIHYGNEFISQSIPNNMLRAMDIRLLRDIKQRKCSVEEAIKKYNRVIEAAQEILNNNLQLPIREASHGVRELDVNRIARLRKL